MCSHCSTFESKVLFPSLAGRASNASNAQSSSAQQQQHAMHLPRNRIEYHNVDMVDYEARHALYTMHVDKDCTRAMNNE